MNRNLARLVPFPAFLALALCAAQSHARQIDVVASIKPVHSLVAAVMEGAGAPTLIVEGAGSPHTYAMRPSQAEALEKAALVFWVGPGLEHFLERPLTALARSATIVELDNAKDVTRLPSREGGMFEPDPDEVDAGHDGGHAHADDQHDHGSFDPHVWLDPENAEAMVTAIGAALSAADPTHAKLYAANVAREKARIEALAEKLDSELADVRGKPFVVFHDAYHYFERRFDIPAAGSVTVSPEVMPGAARLSDIHAKIAGLDAACVFAEPEFEPKFLRIVTEGSNARTAILDPLGADIEDGPKLYFTLLDRLAENLRGCLTAARAR